MAPPWLVLLTIIAPSILSVATLLIGLSQERNGELLRGAIFRSIGEVSTYFALLWLCILIARAIYPPSDIWVTVGVIALYNVQWLRLNRALKKAGPTNVDAERIRDAAEACNNVIQLLPHVVRDDHQIVIGSEFITALRLLRRRSKNIHKRLEFFRVNHKNLGQLSDSYLALYESVNQSEKVLKKSKATETEKTTAMRELINAFQKFYQEAQNTVDEFMDQLNSGNTLHPGRT